VNQEGLRHWRSPQPFLLDNGAVLESIELSFRTWGQLNARGDNAVVVCHALTGDPHADRWWAPLFGAGKVLDPERDFIVCANALGSCYGSSGPASRDAQGRRQATRFPRVSIRDQVRSQMHLLDALGVRHIAWVVGGSMGGLQAIEWALLDPTRVQAVSSVAASAKHSAWCIGWSEAQRIALRADANFHDGNYSDEHPPLAGLAAARAIAMASYRSAASFEDRFGRRVGNETFGNKVSAHPAEERDFAVAHWLRHHGDLLNARFDANCYDTLLASLDSHDVGRGRGGVCKALGQITIPVQVVSIPADALYVPADQFALVEALPCAELSVLRSEHGHDGFLIDADRLEPILRRFRQTMTKAPRQLTAA
jgi:homoserine O-acetyltransferase